MRKYDFEINGINGQVEAHNIRLATMKALYVYADKNPFQSQEVELKIIITPAK